MKIESAQPFTYNFPPSINQRCHGFISSNNYPTMTNGSTGGDDQGSPSSPPHSIEDSPRRRQPTATRAIPPPPTPLIRPPVMGVPGQSAFTPYTRPLQPGSSSGPSGGSGSGYVGPGHGFHVAQAVSIGGVAPAGALRIGGSPAARKRLREGGGEGNRVNCSVCGKAFMSPKALFGHMRSHPHRGWKGAHPPPAFRAEEEFADLGGLILPEEQVEAAAEGPREEEEEEAEDYRLPDLNNPPPPDAN